jgi:hypothetical protein
MILSQRKISANQRNARASTGPRTAVGKIRAKRNSYRHGLSISLHAMFPRPPEITVHANAFAGPNSDPTRMHFATIAAEAEFEVLRVQDASRALLESKMPSDSTGLESEHVAEDVAAVLRELNRLSRYEHRAISRRDRALKLL